MTDKVKPTPLEMRQVTNVSLNHCVDEQAVDPTRTRPLQSARPALLPCTDTPMCAVDGCRAGDTNEMIRGCKISGNTICDCDCKGRPSARKIDSVATDDDPAAMVNPGMRHTTAALDAAAADGADNSRSSGPLGGVKAEEIMAPETFKFEHVAPTAELVLNETKRTPVTETILKEMTTEIWNAIVKVTL